MARLSTVAAFGFDDFDPPVILDLYRQLGCVSCQFYRNPANPPTARQARAVTRDAGVPIDSIHGLFGPEYDPSSPDARTRRAAVDTYRREGDLAAELGGPMVVVHPSPFAPGGDEILPGERRRRVDPLRRSMEQLAAAGEKTGIVYLFENNPDFAWIGNDPIELAGWIRQLGSPHVRMCFDIGHANMTGSVADRLALGADVIGYMHVHDNDGRLDNHQLPGRGHVDWAAVRRTLRATSLKAPAMLELFYVADELREFIAEGVGRKLAHWLDAEPDADRPTTETPNVVHSRAQ